MGIDTSGFKGTSKTAHGGVRNLKEFWKLWSEKYPETLSKANLERLEMKPNARAPIVDEHWIEHFPEHRGYRGQTLTIQHLDQGPIGVPVPKDAHLKGPGPAIWNPPYKPPPGWENWTPP